MSLKTNQSSQKSINAFTHSFNSYTQSVNPALNQPTRKLIIPFEQSIIQLHNQRTFSRFQISIN